MRVTRTNTLEDRPITIGFVGSVGEYRDALMPFVKKGRMEIRDYPNARSVLRRAAVERNALWLIGIDLLDLSGLDLFEMIRDRLRDSTVCMIGSAYCQADEVRAYRAGATIYAGQPLETAWLQSCVELLLGDHKSRGVVGFTNPRSAKYGQRRRNNGMQMPAGLCSSDNNGQ